MEVHHKTRGYLGSYRVLWHEFWYRKFRTGEVTTEKEADKLYNEGGYRGFLPRSDFIRDFHFQWSSWKKNKGPKPKPPDPYQNTLFS